VVMNMHAVRRRGLTALAVTCFVMIGILLAACKRTGSLPPSGRVDLEFYSASESGTFFRLENGSAQTIAFRGAHHLFAADEAWDAGMKCQSRESSSAEAPVMLVGGGETIRVSPGDQIRIKVNKTVPSQYKGGRCRLQLELQDRTVVESAEFARP
jgi:hypothetical protein